MVVLSLLPGNCHVAFWRRQSGAAAWAACTQGPGVPALAQACPWARPWPRVCSPCGAPEGCWGILASLPPPLAGSAHTPGR